jgi:hypothetical protein
MDRRDGVAVWRASTFRSSERFAKLASGKIVCIIFVTLCSFVTVPLINFRISGSSRNNSDNEEYQSLTGIFHSFLKWVYSNLLSPEMRRAVRDYKYEVNESRMTDECIQYLTQLQKDWERHRVKSEVEVLRKEVFSYIVPGVHKN